MEAAAAAGVRVARAPQAWGRRGLARGCTAKPKDGAGEPTSRAYAQRNPTRAQYAAASRQAATAGPDACAAAFSSAVSS